DCLEVYCVTKSINTVQAGWVPFFSPKAIICPFSSHSVSWRTADVSLRGRVPSADGGYTSRLTLALRLKPASPERLAGKAGTMAPMEHPSSPSIDLSVTLGRLRLRNPILVASGTFGYAREMEGVVDFAWLGGIIPKTVTRQPRLGNPPPRTVETPSGMLNAIGLDNDGIEHFIRHHLPYLPALPTPTPANLSPQNYHNFPDTPPL